MSRRSFLGLGASFGVAALVAACGGGSDGTSTGAGNQTGTLGAGSPSTPIDVEGDLQIVKRFAPTGTVPGTVRLPVSLADSTGILGNDGSHDFPASLTASTVDATTGKTVFSGVVAQRHGDDLSVPYWPIVAEVTTTGIYVLRIDEAPGAEVSFQVEDPAVIAMPVPGRALPPFDTPTLDDSRGVSPICTRSDGPCPFHDVTLTDALAAGKPVVYLVGTPAHCTTGTCAPALEALIDVATAFDGKATFVHADVYADEAATKIAPAVTALKMQFEPALFVTDANGIVTTRLDVVFDAEEIRAALATAGIS